MKVSELYISTPRYPELTALRSELRRVGKEWYATIGGN